MARHLARVVHVRDDNYAPHEFRPGDEVPRWAVERITNPDVWADNIQPPGPAPAEDDTPAEPVTDAPQAPPTAGPGSGRAAWAVYARSLGLTVPDDAQRDEIIALTQK